MRCRRPGRKPAIALWMLIAIADLAILVAATGAATSLMILVALAGGVVATRTLLRRSATAGETVARPRA